MKRLVAVLLCGVLISSPARAMRMDYFQSAGRSAKSSEAARQGSQSWMRQALLKNAEKPGEDGLTPMGRWLMRTTAAGLLLTLPAVNAVGQTFLTDFLNAPDLEDRKARMDTGVAYFPASQKFGVMALFQAGQFQDMVGYPEAGQVRTPLADIANDGRLAGGSHEELKALVSATAGVVLNSPDRKDVSVMMTDGNRLVRVEAPGLGMAVLTRPDGQVVDLLRGTGLTTSEKAAVMAVGLLGAGRNRPDYESLGLEPDVFQGILPDAGPPAKPMGRFEALDVSLKLDKAAFVPLQENVVGNRRTTMYKSYEQWRAENPERADVEKPGFGAAFNEKGLSLVDNVVAKPVSLGAGVVVGAIKTLFGIVATAITTVANVVTLGQWDKGREMLAGSAASMWNAFKETTRYAVGIPAGAAGWLLSFSPKGSAIRRFSERLDNWSLRGAFVTNDELMGSFRHKIGAKFLIAHGIDNNGAEDVFLRSVEI